MPAENNFDTVSRATPQSGSQTAWACCVLQNGWHPKPHNSPDATLHQLLRAEREPGSPDIQTLQYLGLQTTAWVDRRNWKRLVHPGGNIPVPLGLFASSFHVEALSAATALASCAVAAIFRGAMGTRWRSFVAGVLRSFMLKTGTAVARGGRGRKNHEFLSWDAPCLTEQCRWQSGGELQRSCTTEYAK